MRLSDGNFNFEPPRQADSRPGCGLGLCGVGAGQQPPAAQGGAGRFAAGLAVARMDFGQWPAGRVATFWFCAGLVDDGLVDRHGLRR